MVKFFHDLVCPLTVVLPQIFFSLTTLFSYSVFFCLFHAPLDVAVHFLVFLKSFRFESFRSQLSPFFAQIKNFCSGPSNKQTKKLADTGQTHTKDYIKKAFFYQTEYNYFRGSLLFRSYKQCFECSKRWSLRGSKQGQMRYERN